MVEAMEKDVRVLAPLRCKGALKQTLAFAALGATSLLYLEQLKAQQAPEYAPISPGEVLGVLSVFMGYFLVLAVTSCFLFSVFKFTTRIIPPILLNGMLLYSVMLVLCTVLGMLAKEGAPVPWRVTVVVLTLLFLLGGLHINQGWITCRRWTGSWSAALIIAMVGLQPIRDAFIFHENSVTIATVFSMIMVIACGIFFMIFTALRPHVYRRILLTCGWAVLMLAGPFVFRSWMSGGFRPVTDDRSKTPNLLFITCDALRADACSTYGGETPTPAMDALAREGVLFENAYVLSPWTLPSMTGLFSSAYPPGLTPGSDKSTWRRELVQYHCNPDGQTLAESLQAQGYTTMALLGNPLLEDHKGFTRGFDEVITYHPRTPVRSGFWLRTPFFHDLLARVWPAAAPMRPIDLSRKITWHARGYIRNSRQAPFYLWIHHFDPHSPYDPPRRFRSMNGPWSLFAPGMKEWGTPVLDLFEGLEIDAAHKPYVESLYRGEIQYVDACIGELLQDLDAYAIRQHTFVCLSSDHGEQFWEHDEYGHGQSLYDEEVRVPLVFTGPGISAGTVESGVSCIDLMPTLADLMGVAADPDWEGASLTPLLYDTASTPPSRPCFAQATYLYRWPSPLQMVREGSLKLVRETGGDAVQLYDLATDPLERADIAAQRPGEVQHLSNLLDAWEESFQSLLHIPTEEDDTQAQETEEQLRALGYLD